MTRRRWQRAVEATVIMDRERPSDYPFTRSESKRLASAGGAAPEPPAEPRSNPETNPAAPDHKQHADSPALDELTHTLTLNLERIEERMRRLEATVARVQAQHASAEADAKRRHAEYDKHIQDAHATYAAFNERLTRLAGAGAQRVQAKKEEPAAKPPPKAPPRKKTPSARTDSPLPLPTAPRRSARVAARTRDAFDETDSDGATPEQPAAESSEHSLDDENTDAQRLQPWLGISAPSREDDASSCASSPTPRFIGAPAKTSPIIFDVASYNGGMHAMLHDIIVQLQQMLTPTHDELDQYDLKKYLTNCDGVYQPSQTECPDVDERYSTFLKNAGELYNRITATAQSRNIPVDEIYADAEALKQYKIGGPP